MIGELSMPRICVTLVVLLGLAACGDDLPDDIMGGDDSPPAMSSTSDGGEPVTTTSTTSAATTSTSASSSSDGEVNTFGALDECEVSSDCARGLLCVAPFDESLGPEGKGLNECVMECVVIMDEARWCADAAACCDPEAECTDRGYCVFPGGSTGSTGSTGGSSSGTTGGGSTSTG